MESNDSANQIPTKSKSESTKSKSKKRHTNKFYKNKIRKKNPSIFKFNVSSTFIYEPVRLKNYLVGVDNKNLIKPSDFEYDFLSKAIDEIKKHNSENEQISVLPFFSIIIDNLQKVEKKIDNKDLLIENIIKGNNNGTHLSIRKITEKFNNICGNYNLNKISKTQVHRIVKKNLRYSYRKTKIKTNKLIDKNSIMHSYFFLKIFLRSLVLNIEPIYLDEAGFFTVNNNFYTWRRSNEEIFHKIEDRERTNLIMAVGRSKVYYYEINRKNTNNEIFENFMNNLIQILNKEVKKNHLIIMDNLSVHLTVNLFKLYNENKLKILFNIPYKSSWNMIELVFRLIKNITYKNIYQNINGVEKDIIDIIKSGKIEKSLNLLYKETLLNYFNFINLNKGLDLNLIDI